MATSHLAAGGSAMTGLGKQTFRHEALFYSGREGFLAGVLPFVRDAVAAREPVLVVVDAEKIEALKAELNDEGDAVLFADMAGLGRNPACIIPAWREFVAEHGAEGRPIRGVGEPIWAGRSEAELVECHHHESLLNLAFAETPSFWLVCPYDAAALDEAVLDKAQCTHPVIARDDARHYSSRYVPPESGPGPFDDALPEPVAEPEELGFHRHGLREARNFVAQRAERAGLAAERVSDLVLAVSELATNSVLHGGGGGTVRLWREPSRLVCEIRDAGRLDEPLVGRERPTTDRASGRGLWLVNHLCDLVQLRSLPEGCVARVHMGLNEGSPRFE
jgi:anti-sigma regulatory factor (Ser/Thr protein kinase)